MILVRTAHSWLTTHLSDLGQVDDLGLPIGKGGRRSACHRVAAKMQ